LVRPVDPARKWIKAAGLKYVTLRKGRYLYRPYLGNGKYGPEILLAPESAKPQEVIRAYDQLQRASRPQLTIAWLLDWYLETVTHLAPRTIKNYQDYRDKICGFHSFGTAKLTQVDAFLIREYLDNYHAPIYANRHIQLLKAAWNYALERVRDLPPNPCMGVQLNKQEPRTRYITDEEYIAAHAIASEQRTPYLAIAMELAYLLRGRIGEVLALRKEHLLEDGVLLQRAKGSKDEITQWSDRLQRAIDAAEKLHPATISPWVLHNADGSPISYNAYKESWQRCRHKMIESGAMPADDQFTFHDLKARGITDHPTKHGGHRSKKMQAVYDRLPDLIPSTR
jgi:integrase